jgi:hypothetical protein
MSSSEKIDLLSDFAAVFFICLRPRTSYHPPLHTIYVYTLIHTGKGGFGGKRVESEIGESGNSSQSWVENTNMTDCISSEKHLPQSPYTGQLFLDDDILLWRLYS